MTLQQIIFAIGTVLTLAIGQVLFKLASDKIDIAGKGLLNSFLLNPHLLIALAIYGLATFAWLFVIKGVPLRIAYPFAALAFIMVPLLAALFLGEPLSLKTFVGAGLIIAGVYISTN